MLAAPATYPGQAAWYRDVLSRWRIVQEFPSGPGPALTLLGTGLDGQAMQVRSDLRFGEELALLGYDLGATEQGPGFFFPAGGEMPPRQFRPGETLGLTLLWRPLRKPAGDYQLFIHLRDANGQIVAQRDTPPQNDLYPAPTSQWHPDALVFANGNLALPPTLAPGSYTLVLGLYPPGQRRLPVRQAADPSPLPSDEVSLGPIEIVAGAR